MKKSLTLVLSVLLALTLAFSFVSCSEEEPVAQECTVHADKNHDNKCDVCQSTMPVEEPTEEDPTVEDPTEDDPTVEEPTEEDPTVEDPTVEEPTKDDPTKEEPTKEEPTKDEPTKEEPTVEDPTVEEPTKEEPTVDPSTPHRHVPDAAERENYVAPTCTKAGHYDSVVYCNICRVEMMRERITLDADHTPTKELVCSGCGEAVPYFRDGKYLYFGEYPQTLKAKNVIITTETDERGYYLGRDGYYYAKIAATPYDLGYKFTDGSIVMNKEVFYFKVEPIRWRILSEDDGSILLLCDSIIANESYDATVNNYKDSDIRTWLNSDFYEQAFNALQAELITLSTVDNSAASTGYSGNPYTSVATIDKLFLLSYKEVTNNSYGFSSSLIEDVMRRKMVTDYARATGAYIETENVDEYGNGYWRLRSPDYLYSNLVECVNYIGLAGNYDYVYSAYIGVVPALRISVE